MEENISRITSSITTNAINATVVISIVLIFVLFVIHSDLIKLAESQASQISVLVSQVEELNNKLATLMTKNTIKEMVEKTSDHDEK